MRTIKFRAFDWEEMTTPFDLSDLVYQYDEWYFVWNKSIILYPWFNNTSVAKAVLMHELLHYTFFAMDTAWIPYTSDTEEAFTYFFEYVSWQVFEKIIII